MNKVAGLFVSPQSDDRNNNINAIRFIAAAMVIYGHMGHLGGYPVPQLFGEDISTIAVKVFFVLSGYLITQSYLHDGNIFRYGIRRVFRIFPGLIFVCFVTTFLICPFISTLGVRAYLVEPGTYLYFIKNSLMHITYGLPGVFADNIYPGAVNGSLWTLPVEFSLYIVLPLFVVLFKKLHILKPGLIFVSVALIVFEIVHVTFFPEWRFIIWGTNIFDGLALSPYFFVGAVFTFAGFQKRLSVQWAVLLAFITGVVMLNSYWKIETLLFLTLPYITLSLSFASPAVFGRLFAVNDYSYGLYLWGFFVQQLLVHFIGGGVMGILPYTLLCLAVSTVCAMVSWHLVEKPCNALGKRITRWSRERDLQRKKMQEPVA